MTSSPKAERFVYYVPFPPLSRGIALAFALFFLCAFLYIPFAWGLQHSLQSMHDDPSLWLIFILLFGPGIAFFVVLAFPPKSWLSRLEVQHDRIRLVPKPPLRWIGEPTREIPIDEGCEQILVCHGSSDSIPLGFRVCVVAGKGQRRVLQIASAMRLARQQATDLVDGIAKAIGLPVYLIQRIAKPGEAVQEVPWLPEERSMSWRPLGVIALGLAPWIGGIVVGFLGMGTAVAAVVGVCLWLCQTASLMIYARLSDRKSKFPMIRWFSTVFTFAASYIVAYAVTAFLVRG